MDAQQIQLLLEELDFSASLPAEVIERLAAESILVQMPAGCVIFREGSQNRNLYLVRTGRVALEMNVPGQGTARILTLGPGDLVGWSTLLDDGKMTTSAVTVDDTEVIIAAADKLQQLCEANHLFGFHLMRHTALALSKQLVATRLQLLDSFAASHVDPSLDAPQEG